MKKVSVNLLGSKKNKILSFSPTQTIIFGFAALIGIGTILLSLPIASNSGQATNLVDALFTATSAVCVTGLVVFDTRTYWSSFGQIVILLLIQIGALGIMSMATLFSLIVGRRMGLKERLTIKESLNEFTLSGVVRTLKNILIATGIIELVGAIILSTQLIPVYGLKDGIVKSIFHSVSAFCNAGFDIFGSPDNKFVSLSLFINNPIILITISLLVIVGGLGFIVWRDVIEKKRFSRFTLHSRVALLATLILIVGGTFLIFVFDYNNPYTLGKLPFISKITNAYFHAIVPRTAGFSTLPVGNMDEASILLTLLFMFIGAAPGSTGGGVKVTTISVLVFAVISYIKGHDEVNIMDRRVADSILKKSLSIIVISIALIFVTTMVLLINNEGSFVQVLFEATSAFGTVGLSTGITPDLNTISKLQIIPTMFLGRVGPLSFALLLTLKHNVKKTAYRYPEGRITVG